MSIDDDAYFELMMNNCWRMNNATTKLNEKKGWNNKEDSGNNKSSLQDNYNKMPQTSNIKKSTPGKPEIIERGNNKDSRAGQAPNNRNQNQRDNRYNVNESEVAEDPRNNKQILKSEETEQAQGMNKASTLILEKFRERLISRGGRGFIGLQRQFKIFDDNNSKTLEYTEFLKACKDFKVDLNPNEIKILFNSFDNDGSGVVDYNEFLREVRGEMNDFRKKITLQAFDKLDQDRSGVVEISEIKALYNCKHHPDVKSGKKTEEEVYGEFIETFEMHHGNTKGRKDKRCSREEFLEYYNNISASIDLDEYFEVMMNSAWKLTSQPDYMKNKAWTDKTETSNTAPKKHLKSSTCPYGQTEQKTSYETSNLPRSNNKNNVDVQKEESAVDKFRNKLKARGSRGIMALRRCFMICDDDNSKSLNQYELEKICNDYRIGLTKNEVQYLFKSFDTNNNRSIDYEEFLRGVVGEMNNFRKELVKRAFEKLDTNRNGIVEVEDIRGVYNAKLHPDVLAGKKTEDEVLAEFLDTFEYHFTLLVRYLFNYY